MKRQLKNTGHYFPYEGGALPIIVRKLATSRRMIIRYQPRSHSLSLTLPRYVSLKQGLSFIEEKRHWIMREIQSRPSHIPFAHGQILPLLGQEVRIEHVGGRGLARIEDGKLLVTGQAEFLPRRVQDFIKSLALCEITRHCEVRAAALGVAFKKITVRDTSSHWGTCNKDGHLSFSWRLIFAPSHILDYVVCHEVAHLLELNHSPAFWAQVARVYPDYDTARAWLKQHGSGLYLYG